MKGSRFRSGFGDETRNGRTSQLPYRIARRYGAVLLITGDNIVNMDADKKGPILRDGYVYHTARGDALGDLMAWNAATQTFDLFPRGTMTVETLQERGYRDVYSFGPILIQDGSVDPRLQSSFLYTRNPRTGVGTVGDAARPALLRPARTRHL